MTNEQAIKELQESHDIMRNHDIDESESYLMQALNMAIKALQAQADGEYILKKDVMGCIGQTSLHWELARKLRKLPSVAIPSAEPREVLYSGDGYADGEMVYDMAECMNCGREFEYDDETWGCNFCPDCGQALKWEGEQE